jgi:hypothetical protein
MSGSRKPCSTNVHQFTTKVRDVMVVVAVVGHPAVNLNSSVHHYEVRDVRVEVAVVGHPAVNLNSSVHHHQVRNVRVVVAVIGHPAVYIFISPQNKVRDVRVVVAVIGHPAVYIFISPQNNVRDVRVVVAVIGHPAVDVYHYIYSLETAAWARKQLLKLPLVSGIFPLRPVFAQTFSHCKLPILALFPSHSTPSPSKSHSFLPF